MEDARLSKQSFAALRLCVGLFFVFNAGVIKRGNTGVVWEGLLPYSTSKKA
jgi:hypothetical protein